MKLNEFGLAGTLEWAIHAAAVQQRKIAGENAFAHQDVVPKAATPSRFSPN